MPKYDVVVVGLGAMGSAALYQLARRGVRVLGIERHELGHDQGSSHGETRIIRLGYFENHAYVPLLRRAYALWREIETAAKKQLLHITGIVEIGPPDGRVVPGTMLASRVHNLPHEVLTAQKVKERFPAFNVPSDYIGVVQPEGGYLAVERSLAAMVDLARASGGEVQTGVTVRSISSRDDGVRLKTSKGTIETSTLVVTAGPWVKKLLPDLPAPIRVTRQVMAWFQPVDNAVFRPAESNVFAPGRLPVFMLECQHGIFYGFPPGADGSLKIAKHHHVDQEVDPDNFNRAVSPLDEGMIRPMLADYMQEANGKLAGAKTCLYTVTPDGDFIIDRMPNATDIIVASPCSGHGFKFAPVVGEILADLALSGATHHDISRFRLNRFQ